MATITKRKWKTSKGEEREAWMLDFTDKSGKRHKEQFAKKREADARKKEVDGQISAGTYRAEAKEKTVKDAIDAYTDHIDKQRDEDARTSMYAVNVRGLLTNHATPKIGTMRLDALRSTDVHDMIEELKGAGVGVPTLRRLVGTLARVLDHANTRKGWIAINAARGVKVDSKRGEGTKKIVAPSKAALTAILKAADEMKTEGLRLRVMFAASTGLRASEQWALKWAEVDLKDRTVIVNTRVDGFGKFEATKSKAGARTIPLSKTLNEALKAWKKAKAANDEDFVFPAYGEARTDKGGYTRHTNFMKRQWKPLLEKAEVGDVGWHSLRHFAVSTWIEAGLKPKEVQTLAGHASYHITMDRYGHMFESDDHGAAMDAIASKLYAT